jgi:hypothetical protein
VNRTSRTILHRNSNGQPHAGPLLLVVLLTAGLWSLFSAAAEQKSLPKKPLPAQSAERTEMETLDAFLDSHPNVAAGLHVNPSLVRSGSFLAHNRDFSAYLDAHPTVGRTITERPDVFRNREQRLELAGAVGANPKLKRTTVNWFDHYLMAHPSVETVLRPDPNKIDSPDLKAAHSDLAQFLKTNPAFSEHFRKRPAVFLNRPDFFAQPRLHTKRTK